jgi:hypothetical protein
VGEHCEQDRESTQRPKYREYTSRVDGVLYIASRVEREHRASRVEMEFRVSRVERIQSEQG